VEKDLKKRCLTWCKYVKTFFLEVAQNGIDKGANIKLLAEKIEYTSKS
jgi:hypothetical protein